MWANNHRIIPKGETRLGNKPKSENPWKNILEVRGNNSDSFGEQSLWAKQCASSSVCIITMFNPHNKPGGTTPIFSTGNRLSDVNRFANATSSSVLESGPFRAEACALTSILPRFKDNRPVVPTSDKVSFGNIFLAQTKENQNPKAKKVKEIDIFVSSELRW